MSNAASLAPAPVGADPYAAFREELIERGLLIPTGVPGVFGRSGAFEDVIERISRYVSASGSMDAPQVMRFPPLLPRQTYERSDHLKSFPDLAGSVHGFVGGDAEHAALLRRLEHGEDWTGDFAPTEVVLTPAACYPVYPTASGTLPPDGKLIDVMTYCFRHEPSADPARLQMFRQHEHVRIGSPDQVRAFRDLWLERAQEMLRSLGLEVAAVVANDPFFGRAGRMLAANQRDQSLKFELVAPISRETPTAVVSCNYHQDHFGQLFGISTADGAVAHTACVGFGLERIALAMVRAHGFDPSGFPTSVRATLGW